MKRIMPRVGVLALVSAAVLSGCGEKGDSAAVVREEPSLAGFRLGEVIDVSSAAVLKERGLKANEVVSVPPKKELYALYHVIAPPAGLASVLVFLSTNHEVVCVSARVNCQPGETVEGLMEKWKERFKGAISPDGPNRLMFEPAKSLYPAEFPDSLCIDIMTADYERNAMPKPPAK